jgi:very-short-patch-repair endonuclease
MFLPNCMARLNGIGGRVNREPDFLVCDGGRWGILEVDGDEFHPPTRTAQDHERDRLFLSHGVRLVQHFDAVDCFTTPRNVVEDFLHLLRAPTR